MTTYRLLTPKEIKDLTLEICASKIFDLKDIRETVLDLFGETSHKIILELSSEYNDENDELVVSDIIVKNKSGQTLEYDESKEDDFYDFKRDICIRGAGESDSFTIYVNPNILNLKSLYIQEDVPERES